MKTMQFLVSEIIKLTMTKKALLNTNSEEHIHFITAESHFNNSLVATNGYKNYC